MDLDTGNDLDTLAWLDTCDLRERELAVRGNQVWAPRLISLRERFPCVPGASARGDDVTYRLSLDNPGQIGGLQMKTCEPAPLGPHDVEIEVAAAALNFRDVMVTLGLLPSSSFERSALGRTVGMEASGIVRRAGADVRTCRTGDAVVFTQGGCIANRTVVKDYQAEDAGAEHTIAEPAPAHRVPSAFASTAADHLRNGTAPEAGRNAAPAGAGALDCLSLAEAMPLRAIDR